MSEKNKNIYNVCTDKDKVLPELWRVVFLARISNIKAVENVEVKVLSEDELAQIAQAPYSDALAHLLIMYGAGYFSFDNLSSIARDAPDYKDEIYAAEDFIIEQAGLDEKERVSEHIIQNILLCTINSKKYSEIQPIGFDTARQLCENKHTVILNGFVFVKDMSSAITSLFLLTGQGIRLRRFLKMKAEYIPQASRTLKLLLLPTPSLPQSGI